MAEDYPLLQKIPDVNEPASGYLWGNLAAHGKKLLPLRRVHFDRRFATRRGWPIRRWGR